MYWPPNSVLISPLGDLHARPIFRCTTKWSKEGWKIECFGAIGIFLAVELDWGLAGRVLQVKERALEKDFQMCISLYSETAKSLIFSLNFFKLPQSVCFLEFGFKTISPALCTLWCVRQVVQVILWEPQQNRGSLAKTQECVFEKLCVIKYLPSDICTNHYIFINVFLIYRDFVLWTIFIQLITIPLISTFSGFQI